MNVFIHHPLDLRRKEIRLVKLRDERNTGVSCEVQHFCTDDASLPVYDALSYTWGRALDITTITLNTAPYTIRTNLCAFLEEAKRRSYQDWIWIDQLCISQDDSNERNHQVSMMSEIYECARKVVVWLGQPINQDPVRLSLYLDDHELELDQKFPSDHARSMRAAVNSFCNNSYWERLWIIQEIKLAANFIIWWGHIALTETQIKNLLARTRHDATYHRTPMQRERWDRIKWLVGYLSAHEPLLRKEDQIRMLELPKMVIRSACVDPRDTVYGLQSILHPESRIQIDYSKEVSAVFDEVIVALIAEMWPRFANNEGELLLTTQVLNTIYSAMMRSNGIRGTPFRNKFASFAMKIAFSLGLYTSEDLSAREDLDPRTLEQMSVFFNSSDCEDRDSFKHFVRIQVVKGLAGTFSKALLGSIEE